MTIELNSIEAIQETYTYMPFEVAEYIFTSFHEEDYERICDEISYISEAEKEEWLDEVMFCEVPEYARTYIDYDRVARDMYLGGDWYELDGGWIITNACCL